MSLCLTVNSACLITRTSWRASRACWRQHSSESASRKFLVTSSTTIQDKERFLVTLFMLLKRRLKAVLMIQRARIFILSVLLLHPHCFYFMCSRFNGGSTLKTFYNNKDGRRHNTQSFRLSLHIRMLNRKSKKAQCLKRVSVCVSLAGLSFALLTQQRDKVVFDQLEVRLLLSYCMLLL